MKLIHPLSHVHFLPSVSIFHVYLGFYEYLVTRRLLNWKRETGERVKRDHLNFTYDKRTNPFEHDAA